MVVCERCQSVWNVCLYVSSLIVSCRAKLADAIVPPNLAVSPPTNPNAKELWYGNVSAQNGQPSGSDSLADGVVVDKVVALGSSVQSSVVRFKNSEDDGQR